MKKMLEKAYDPEQFRKQGHELIDKLADYLKKAQTSDDEPVFTAFDPNGLYAEWEELLQDNNEHAFGPWAQKVMDDSIHLHNPGYMGHQVSPVLPQAALADLMSALLNNGVGVYEMGSPTVAMERVVIKHLAEQIGFDDAADGILTSGGTLGNLTALLAMRQVKAGGDTWNNGTGNRKLGVLVSEQAHYSIDRAAKILGWGDDGIVKVPVDAHYRLNPSQLDETLEKAKNNGIEVIGVIGSACCTATGTFDPLNRIASFCEQHDLWFHVDAAHGGGALYSQQHRALLNGIERADSVIVDFHKMMMCPALVTGVVFKDGRHSYQTFAQKAEYLWKQDGEEWYNLGKRTFECTKNMMALKVFSTLQAHGTELFEANTDRLFDLARKFEEVLQSRSTFELLTEPESNIVCFRYLSTDDNNRDELNEEIRKTLIAEGNYFIVQTSINGEVYLRTTLMNPFTTEDHLRGLLDAIERIGRALTL